MTFELPDPGAIAEQLAQAQAARSQLDRVIAWLENGVELFSGDAPAPALPAAAKPAEKPKPARAAQTGPRSTGRNIEAKIIKVVLEAAEPLSRSEIAEQVGTTTSGVKNPLQRLVKAGRVLAEGVTRNRVYRAAPREPHTEHGARTSAGRERAAADFDDGVARVRLRDQCIKAIAADPDALTEDRLSQALEAPRDAVAEACGWLLMRERIALNPDGTYRRAGTRELAA